MKNSSFAIEFIELSKKVIEDVRNIDPKSPTASAQLEKAHIMNDAIKQANNTYRSALQHDIAKAKYKEYHSSFLELE